MARVITFAQTFQGKHPRKGQPTWFTLKVLNGIHDQPEAEIPGFNKHHTFRGGHRWQLGDMFSPRHWEGKPYRSPLHTFYEDLQIKKIWDLEYKGNDQWFLNGRRLWPNEVEAIANNDGLELQDFLDWFPSPVRGQLYFVGRSY